MKYFFLLFVINNVLIVFAQRKYDIDEIKISSPYERLLVHDTPINGIVYSRYPNGELKSSILYKDGVKKGFEIEYYEDGEIKSFKDYIKYSQPSCAVQVNKKGEKKVYKYNGQDCGGALADQIINPCEINNDNCQIPDYLPKQFKEFFLSNIISINNTFDGNYKSYFPNGLIKSELNYSKGKLSGQIKSWFDNGLINMEMNFYNGYEHGVWRIWDQNGQIIYEENYKNGKLHGLIQTWNYLGEITHQELWNNGKLENRKCLSEYETIEINYIDNKKNGFYRKWTPYYTIEIKYLNDKKHGLYRKWENEILRYECEYKNDLKDGLEKEIYNDGITEKQYKNNQLVKIIQKKNNWITTEENYVDGVISNIKYYGLVSDGSNNTVNSTYQGQEFYLNGVLNFSFQWDDCPNTREEKNIIETSSEGRFIYLYNFGYLHGEQKDFYEKSNPKGELNFRNNLKLLSNFKYGNENGKTYCYYESGKINLELNFLDGKLDGIQSTFHEVGPLYGNPKENITYKNGLVSGLRERFYENRQLELKENYLDNKLHGLSIYWDSNGVKKAELNYSKGLLNGYLRRWYNENQMQMEISYKDGKENGIETTWYPNGNVKSQNSFKNGLLHGSVKKWYEGNIIEFEENYSDNLKDSIQLEYYSNGQIQKKELWKKGTQLSKECWDRNGKLIYCDIIPNNLTIEENGILKNLLTKEIITGNVYEQDDNGILKFDCVYLNGLLNGEKKVFYKNGITKESSNFSNGNLNGLRKTWYENGAKESEEIYLNGILDSIQLAFHENGNIKHKLYYKKGKLNGTIKTMYLNGNVSKEEIYLDGNLNGKQIGWYENGNLQFERLYKIGKKNGLHREYYENGKLKSETTYTENMKTGVVIIWYESGKIMSESSYNEDMLDGITKTYHKNGKTSSKSKYKYNLLISKRCWDENGRKISCE
jgi:antitoxin component YwqK of YwqJK toxin-antitoxin module